MKKKLLNLSFAIILLFAFNSCKKDDDAFDKTLKFSTLSVEDQKKSVEQNGVELANSMDEMMNSKAMIAMNNMSSLFSMNSANMEFVKPFSQLQKELAKQNVKAVSNLDKQLKVAAGNSDGQWGIYTWNNDIEDFDFVAGAANAVTYLFPATENSSTNDGELKITYVESTIAAPDTDPVMYLPTSMTAVLKVSGAVALTANFSATYKSDATPTSLKQTLVIDDYNWSAEMSNNEKKASAKYSFNKGTKVLVKLEAALTGNLTTSKFQESEGPEDVITNGMINFQVMNIALYGSIADMKGFSTEIQNINSTTGKGLSDKEFLDKKATTVNKYVNSFGYFVKEDKKFADIEFFTYEVSDGYYSKYEMQPRFVLSDGTKVEIDEYMQSGFEELFIMIEQFNM